MSDSRSGRPESASGDQRPPEAASPRLLGLLRQSWRDAGGVGRLYVLCAAIWAMVAALLGLSGMLQLAFGLDAPMPALGLGRLDAAYRQSLLLGAISLPLAAGLLAASGFADAPEQAASRARRGLAIWNFGLALGVIGILAGFMRADPWAAMPGPAAGLVWLGALHWAAALWACVGPTGRKMGMPAAAGLMAATGLLLHLGFGSLLMTALDGVGQTLAAASIMRGLPQLWLLPASIGVAAALLPDALGKPLFGRRLALLGLWAWLATSALSLPRDLLPELLPGWLTGPVEVASVLGLAPAVALSALLLGAWIGQAPDAGASAPETDPGASADLRWWPRLLLGASILLAAGMLLEAMLLPGSRQILQFTTWSPASAILPPPGAAWLFALASAWALMGGCPGSARGLRLLAPLALLATVLGLAPLAPLALAETARATGSAGAMLRFEALLRLPGLLLFAFAALLLAGMALRALRSGAGNAPGPWSRPSAVAVPPAIWVASTAAVLAAALFVTSLLPLADPAQGADARSAGAAARQLEPGSLPADGRDIYIAEGCVACHSQRVRDTADQAFGTALGPADHVGGPALAGHRRAGPDLAWAGERYEDPGLLAERLIVHAAGGSPAYPWLFERAGPLPAGRALIEYLARLGGRSSGEGALP